jgi:hypothetical protein
MKGRVKKKTSRRLDEAKIFARLSSPGTVERLRGFSFLADSCFPL